MNHATLNRIILITAALLIFVSTAAADSITLRASVRMPHDRDRVVLGDVADLSGEAALALANTPVAALTDTARVIELSVADVRRALDEASVNWGRVNLNGRRVVLRPRRTAAATPRAMSAAAVTTATPSSKVERKEPTALVIAPADVTHAGTVLGAVSRLVVHAMNVPADRLRLQFDRKDESLLQQTSETHRIEVQPLGSFNGDRVEITVRLWRDGRVVRRDTITLRPMMRVETAELTREIDRNDTISETDVTATYRWLSPQQAALHASRVEAIGRVASKRLKAGEPVRRSDVRKRTVVERGDEVVVRCPVGGLAVSMKAKALDDGAIDDRIRVRKLGDRAEFTGRITAPGEVVVDLD